MFDAKSPYIVNFMLQCSLHILEENEISDFVAKWQTNDAQPIWNGVPRV